MQMYYFKTKLSEKMTLLDIGMKLLVLQLWLLYFEVFFKGCLPQILLGPSLNILSQIIHRKPFQFMNKLIDTPNLHIQHQDKKFSVSLPLHEISFSWKK